MTAPIFDADPLPWIEENEIAVERRRLECTRRWALGAGGLLFVASVALGLAAAREAMQHRSPVDCPNHASSGEATGGRNAL